MQITDQTGRSMGNRRGVAAMVCCGVIAASAGLVATLTSFNGDAVIARGFERAFASIANQAAPAPAFDLCPRFQTFVAREWPLRHRA